MKNIKLKINLLTIFFLFVAIFSGYIKNALYILFIVSFHELGHVVIALILKFKIKKVEIYPFGGISIIERPLNTRCYKEILLAIFGVLFQFILFTLGKMRIITSALFLKYNVAIMLFNLMPIIPLDGTKILFEIYNFFFNYKTSIKLSYITSFLGVIIFFIFNMHYELNNYLIISLFIAKTIEYFKNRDLYFRKFIIERMLYDDISYAKIDNDNRIISKYQKDHKYYYFLKGKIVDQKSYLTKYYKSRK